MKLIFISMVQPPNRIVATGLLRIPEKSTKNHCTAQKLQFGARWKRIASLVLYSFEQNGVTVTVTAERYIEMLNTFFVPELWRRWIAIWSVWFQQDGATSHTSRASVSVLRPLFPNRLVSRFGDVAWPPRSPDLSMCDYFLWGYLTSRVYKRHPRTLDELKDSIRENIVQIDRRLLETVEANFHTRLQQCMNENGIICKMCFSTHEYN